VIQSKGRELIKFKKEDYFKKRARLMLFYMYLKLQGIRFTNTILKRKSNNDRYNDMVKTLVCLP
jgi:hypothetical protein